MRFNPIMLVGAAIASMFGAGRQVQRDLMGQALNDYKQPPISLGRGRYRSEQAKKTPPRPCGGRNLSRILSRYRNSIAAMRERRIVRRPRRYPKLMQVPTGKYHPYFKTVDHPKAGKFYHEFALA